MRKPDTGRQLTELEALAVYKKTVRLDDAAIKGLPSSYGELIPPTWANPSDGSRPPELFAPILVQAALATPTTSYSNRNDPCYFALVWGATWDYTLMWETRHNDKENFYAFGGTPVVRLLNFGLFGWDGWLDPNTLSDNGLYIAMDNGASGDLTDGADDNHLDVTVFYTKLALA